MLSKTVGRFMCAVAVLLFVCSVGSSFAQPENKVSELSKALSQVKLFAGLTDAERESLAEVATMRRGKAGERIIRQGETLDRMFIILEGEAEIWIDGKKAVSVPAQSLVGEIEFLDGLPATADVLLLKETDLVELNYAALNGLMENQPRLGYLLMREIAKIEAQRLRKSVEK